MNDGKWSDAADNVLCAVPTEQTQNSNSVELGNIFVKVVRGELLDTNTDRSIVGFQVELRWVFEDDRDPEKYYPALFLMDSHSTRDDQWPVLFPGIGCHSFIWSFVRLDHAIFEVTLFRWRSSGEVLSETSHRNPQQTGIVCDKERLPVVAVISPVFVVVFELLSSFEDTLTWTHVYHVKCRCFCIFVKL